jgi:xylulokinase
MSLAGIDVGTTACKALVINKEGSIIAESMREYGVITQKKGWFELNPTEVWNAVKEVLKHIAFLTQKDPIEALSISAMGDTVTPFDKELNPLYNSILAFDTRSEEETRYLGEKLSRQWIYKSTGMPLHPTYSASKILWMKNHIPEIFHKTDRFLCYEDYILMKLGAPPTISYSSAARTMMLDLEHKNWNRKILNVCDIDQNQLPKPEPSGVKVGEIDHTLTSDLNLPAHMSLIVGGHDQPCGSLGCGVVSEGTILDTTGTIEVLLFSLEKPLISDLLLEANICCYPHCYPNRYCSFAEILTAGAAFRWFRDQFGYEDLMKAEKNDSNVYDMITSHFSDKPQDLYMVPHLAGCGTPTMNPIARGCIYGLTLDTDKYDIAQAIMEGITYEMRINIELLESIMNVKVQKIRSIGGGARSKFWVQLKANITGRKIVASILTDFGAIGAAILAGYGCGTFSNLEEGIEAVKCTTEIYAPNDEMYETYNNHFQNYLTVREKAGELCDLVQ